MKISFRRVQENGLFHTQKSERIHQQQNCTTGNAKGVSSGRRKIISDGNLDLYKGKVMKGAGNYKYVDKYKIFYCFYIGYICVYISHYSFVLCGVYIYVIILVVCSISVYRQQTVGILN